MKRKITLMEVKNILKTEKVFLNGNNFNYVNVGKYASGCTLVIPQEWNLDCDGKPESPVRYQEVLELTDNMNIDFNGDANVLFGKYHLSQAGKPVFKITAPNDADDVLILVSWGGAFNSSRGNYGSYAKSIGAKYFRSASSNGGGCGNDYWVLPVNFVYDSDFRDVSELLEQLTDKENLRVRENEIRFSETEEKRLASIEMRKKILPACEKLVEQINEVGKEYGGYLSCIFEEEYMEINSRFCAKYPYTKAYKCLQQELETTRMKISNRKKYHDVLQQITLDVETLGGTLSYSHIDNVTIRFLRDSDSYSPSSFTCDSSQHIEEMQKYVDSERQKQKQEQAQIIENMIKAKREQELIEAKKAAKDAGCPETFTYWNRVGGATGQSHAYVIRPDGSIRIPDNNILNNYNHRHQKKWLENADGTQVYDQILIGELIVAYTKDCTKAPVRISIEWAPESITEPQKETVNNIYNDLQRLYDNPQFVNKYGDTILSGNEWLEGKSS